MLTNKKGSHSAPPFRAYDGPSWHDCYDGPFSRPVCFLPSPPDSFRRGALHKHGKEHVP